MDTVRRYLAEEMDDPDLGALERAKGIAVTDPALRRCGRCGEEHDFCAVVNEHGHRVGWLRVTINNDDPEDDE